MRCLLILFVLILTAVGCDDSSVSKTDNDSYLQDKDTDVIADTEADEDIAVDEDYNEDSDITADEDSDEDTGCIENDIKTEDCGYNQNGKQSYTCTNGKWEVSGECNDPDEFLNGNTQSETESCGLNNNGTKLFNCSDGTWVLDSCNDPDECANSADKTETCGFNGNGSQSYICTNGKWEVSGECNDPDECLNGSTQPGTEICGLNNNGTELYTCSNGAWVLGCNDPDECIDKSTKTEAGIFSTCESGHWKVIRKTILLGTTDDDSAESIAVDSAGNVYIAGFTYGALDGVNAGSADAFVIKLNSDGEIQWVKQIGSSGTDYCTSLAIDKSGNIYIAGYTTGDFDGTNAGKNDIFVIKIDSEGNILWKKQIGSSGEEYCESLAIDENSNIYIAGYTYGVLDGTNAGAADAFVIKLNSSGETQWTKQFGGSVYEGILSIAVDISGNIYALGDTAGSFFGTNLGHFDVFIMKLDSDGNITLKKQFGTSGSEFSSSLVLDASGNIYVTGYTSGNFGGTNSGDYDVFVKKFDSTGVSQWTKQFGTSDYDSGYSINLDSSDNIYITGFTMGDFFGTNAGKDDIFFLKLYSSGNISESLQLGTAGNDRGRGIAVSNGNIYVTGYTEGSIDNSIYLGYKDIFLSIIPTE